MRAVLDPNVIISAALALTGAPAQLLRAWQRGAFELVVSDALLRELERALAYPKLRRQIPADDAVELVRWLENSATDAADSHEPPFRSSDPGDDYLIGLAAGARAVLVSGDRHLLELAPAIPVRSPREFFELLG